ncbi:MAG: F0F1 ATP synthase subunit B [Eggerthellales bacterium]|nr:F0F1 ATP synthase subunit B [Eggerthellales bacterium]
MISAGAVFALFPAAALAEESSGIAAILPVMDEFIPMLIAFLILWFVLAKFGWPVFENMLNKRENAIKDALEAAEEAKQASERALAEHDDQLKEAKATAAKIVADAKKSSEGMAAEITRKAQEQADEMIEKARAAIEFEKKAAIDELQGSVADMSISLASRLIGNDLSDDEHRAIIERYVNEAGSFNEN